MFDNPLTEKGQIELTKQKTPEKFKPYILASFEYHIQHSGKKFSRRIIPEIINTATWLHKRGFSSNKKDEISYATIQELTESFIQAEEYLKTIAPEISAIRKDLYGKTDPLFPGDVDAAIEWLIKQANEEAEPLKAKIKQRESEIVSLEKDINSKLMRLSRLAHQECTIDIEALPVLPIPLKIKGRYIGIDHLFVWPRKPLANLEGRTRFLTWRKNISQHALIAYVLTGIKPIPIAYKKTRGTSFMLEFFRSPTTNELNSVIRELKCFFKRPGYKLKPFHQELYTMVKERGGVPAKGVKRFWEEIVVEVNKKHPGKYSAKHGRWRGPRNVYETIKRRLQE